MSIVEEMESSSSDKTSVVVVKNSKNPFGGIKLENPFTVKAFQVFTGFGAGCGVGIGVGQPVNLAAIPVVNQVMSAGSGAVHAFSGVNRHVNDALRKVGAKNIQTGFGCGVGFGHGFGIGVAIKPKVIHQIHFLVMDGMTKLMTKFGVSPNLSIGQDVSLHSNTSTMSDLINQKSLGSTKKMPEHRPEAMPGYGNVASGSATENFASNSALVETPFRSRTEQVVNSFAQNLNLMGDGSGTNESGARLQSETNMLRMVLKHQQIIEEFMEENEKLRQILMDDLKVPPSKLQASHLRRNKSPCTDCFECRRKQRKR